MPSGDPDRKITAALGSRLESEEHELLDIVVELEPDAEGDAAPSAPRLQESFERAAEPVTSTISDIGGEVTGKAWLNRTLRAKVPARRLRELTDMDEIAALDVPHAITPE